MKNQFRKSAFFTQHLFKTLKIAAFLIIVFFLQGPSTDAQSITQPAQIAWGRYFDDNRPGFDWSKEELGDRIYYHENNIYIVGRTKSDTNAFFNCTDSFGSGLGDAFVASYNPACQTYNWISYLGSATSLDYAYTAAFDKVGDTSWIYIAGEVNETISKTNMLTAKSCVTSGCTTVFQPKGSDKKDAFIAKYNLTSGKLVRWTYVGGKGFEQILSMDVDTVTHTVYFAGYTESADFINYSDYGFTPYKGTLTGKGKMFFGGVDSCLNLKYYSYYGGNGSDRAHDLRVLYTANTQYLVMSGTTQSFSGVVPVNGNFYDNTYGGGNHDQENPDAFLLIWNVNTLSSPPDWATYVGGSGIDRGRGIDITSDNDIYFTGQTLSFADTAASGQFVATPDAYLQEKGPRTDCFLTKFHIDSFNAPLGVHRELFTFFGGGKDDYAKSVLGFHTNDASTGNDTIVIAGLTYSSDLASTDTSAYMLSDEINGNGKDKKRDAFIAVLTKDPLNPEAPQKLSSFTYLGGEKDETDIKQKGTLVQKSYNPGISLGPNGCVYIIYTTFGTKTKSNGNIPLEFSAYHAPADSSIKLQPDAYFAEVYPFPQHFVPESCTVESNGKNEMVEKGAVRFYPVPFADVTRLEIKADAAQTARVFIYDAFGKLILVNNISLHPGVNQTVIDLSDRAAGIFLARIIMDHEQYDLKIVKD